MTTTSREVRFSLPSLEVAGKVWGEPGGVPVIGLHGWLDNAATFDRLAPALQGVHLVALDLAGHGLSDHLPMAGYSLWQQASIVLQVAEELGWDRFALLGHSMGAIISGVLAGSLPERILGAAMIDGLMPFTSEADDAPKQMARFFKSSLAVGNKRKPVYDSVEKAVSARVLGGTTPISRDAVSCLVERGLMPDHGGWTWRTDPQLMLPSALRFTNHHAVSFIEAIEAPTMLVLANQGVMHKHPQVLDRIERFKHIQLHKMDGGHHLHLEEQAPAVAALLNDFYAALPARDVSPA
ncbi:Pimeloyl-ACP methyl ester carboxylesterase [Halopseudomonas sabulinigri]|uniref:Pimeloyl-ACP methyl ester carboxylesterase n=1 Tax=Halopseudomonas sabulinigri TaxID=472181 RepID=A0A1H1N237_9GAMM|nr:alpha/beta fold hydrolase [Halopseudomonas sabulinigri]SDR93046.1 Pimeloyl-ACP methyl ester carboxylesterase [Halopseudomonas sabulinigri]